MQLDNQQKFTSVFFTHFNERDYFSTVPFDKYGTIGEGFKSNLQSVISILKTPVTLSEARTKLLMFDQIYTQEAILNAPMPEQMYSSKEQFEETQEKGKKRALENSQKRFFVELQSPSGGKKFWNITFQFLEDCLNSNNDLKVSANEILKQSTVLLWGTFEVLARDILVFLLNKFPEKYKLIGNKSIAVEVLDKYDFNVQNKLGYIFADSHDWSNLSVIRETYKNLFPDNQELNGALKRMELYKLNKRRHLIVHNRGIVDKKYIELTNDNFEIGTELKIFPEELKNSLVVVRDSGAKLLGTLID